MGGQGYEIKCPHCGLLSHIGWGVTPCRRHPGQFLSKKHFVCVGCHALSGLYVGECCDTVQTCGDCGIALERWPGRVELDRELVDGPIGLTVRGPCPRCGNEITHEHAEMFFLSD